MTNEHLGLGKVWWVNHKQTFSQEVGGNYIWSPCTKRNGAPNEFYENMKRVRPGEIVFSFANAAIQAVGICTASAILAPKPEEFGGAGDSWADEGWRVGVRFSRLTNPIRPKDHMKILAPTLPEKYSPIRTSGDGNQGAYLALVPERMFEGVKHLIGAQWAALDLDVGNLDDATQSSDEIALRTIKNRTDISETEKLQLAKARVGQGIYRQNLEQYEDRCRVTGAKNLRHLRASHIIPWRLSNKFEKLDGNNGLLLSPHVDHLFDQGYISFSNDGKLLVSTEADVETLALWRISEGAPCGAFRKDQLPYLEFHREFIFRNGRS